MNQETPILQVVGYQNSGKTTLITQLIKMLKEMGYRVGTLKHHGHDGDALYDDTNKDTNQHCSSGAVVTGVISKGQLQITNGDNFSLEKLLEMYRAFSLDIIMIEGFKNESFPKVLLLRTPEDEKLLYELNNIVFVISWYHPLPNSQIPVFSIWDEIGYLTWTQSFIQKKMSSKREHLNLQSVLRFSKRDAFINKGVDIVENNYYR
ncbi:molybdopterin-guanine dinucleotide biosynthesis protein B [Neobacillus sp. PS3-12]|uniref:molybdopterin-guanine dinucleotide biosynthesis protein B n=1 Tax=Neobacillus sp. PS3-12 TaxID=3070677 RepID=UPI0027DF5F95|nr:molybdopterin-guanine dinucleotide biosynthesis protein B [Neobacillus sp. PS3-12]WML54434.1 molybdopterin-guanine dinucleotide biosynthesis protein B [Neobacillus sp. PS3-12]